MFCANYMVSPPINTPHPERNSFTGDRHTFYVFTRRPSKGQCVNFRGDDGQERPAVIESVMDRENPPNNPPPYCEGYLDIFVRLLSNEQGLIPDVSLP